MTRLRHHNPPRDLSHILPERSEPKKLTKQEKKLRAERRADGMDNRPPLSRAEKQAHKEEAERLYLASQPSRLIKATGKPNRKQKGRKGRAVR